MTPLIAALSRAARSIRQAANRIGNRFTRKAEIKFGITVSFPPFLKLTFAYKANIGEAANNNIPAPPSQSV
jgi:hypothetical protein